MITVYEPKRKFAAKATSGPIPVDGEYTFESVEGGTRVTLVAEAELGGYFKLAKVYPAEALRYR